jgi:hypothetical protein
MPELARSHEPFSIDEHFDLWTPSLYPWRRDQLREMAAVAEAVASGRADGGFLDGLSEAGLREFLRLRLRRVRSRSELAAFLGRYAPLSAYLPPARPRPVTRAALPDPRA